jgi:hypothetical protein
MNIKKSQPLSTNLHGSRKGHMPRGVHSGKLAPWSL